MTLLRILALFALLVTPVGVANAQDWPSRLIRIVVPFLAEEASMSRRA